MYFYQSIIINHCYLNLKSQNLLNNFHIKYSKKLIYHAMLFQKKKWFTMSYSTEFSKFYQSRNAEFDKYHQPI